ncbi:diguanylate cyclase [Virgibacillus flavescens]|uniref:sensor domain-containing diguanylate cyclase n=1 Tax=Virgibacillus flavescens TaxID=1611422 RepID=UPI003D35095C
MVSEMKINILLIIWALFWPLCLLTSYNYNYLNIQGYVLDIILFGVFMCVVAWFPLVINNSPVFFINGISIAVFLSFGLFVEMVLTQIAILLVLARVGVSKKEYYRYPMNLIMFTMISLIGAFVFWLLGGDHTAINITNPQDITAIFGYAITVFIVNQLLIKIINRFFYNRKGKFFDRGFLWEIQFSLIVLPVGFVLYVLYTEIGRIAIFYMGIPFVMISIILKLLYSYQEVNTYLQKTGEIGHQLTKEMKVSEVYDVFTEKLGHLIQMDCAYVYMVVNDHLELMRCYDLNTKLKPSKQILNKNEAFSGKVWANRKPIIYNNAREWDEIKSSKIPSEMESVLSIPVEYNNAIIGVVTIVSKEKKAFKKIHLRILDILINYFGVAMENARNYEATKENSEKDGLTNLYNYRFFNNAVEKAGQTINDKSVYSLILLDLDYFKKVNDTYGHEAGNEILCQFSIRLEKFIGDRGLVARYGGEEFVISLPNYSLRQSNEIAEIIRTMIAEEPFIISNHILPHNDTVEVNITASIGVAAYPNHCESLNELVRHADRAMYLGAKQRGRNRVAVYQELQTI